MAGGSNFAPPVWEATKAWQSRIYALPMSEDGSTGKWHVAGMLPKPLAHGMAVTVPEGIVCIGGTTGMGEGQVTSEVFLLTLEKDGEAQTSPLPSLPVPLSDAGAAVIGSRIYVIGGKTGPGLETVQNTLWCLDWSQREHATAFTWQPLPPLPAPARMLPIVATQSNGTTTCLYVFGGRGLSTDREPEFYKDAYSFNPTSTSHAPWRRLANMPTPYAAGTTMTDQANNVFLISGDDGSHFAQTNTLREKHPGFSKAIHSYHTLTNTWKAAGESPVNQVSVQSVPWRKSHLLPGGEIRPRERTLNVWKIKMMPKP